MQLADVTETIQQSSLGGLAWVDQLGLGLAALFLVLGIWRGLWGQILRLFGLVAAVVVARQLYQPLGTVLESWGLSLGPVLSATLAWFLLFISVMLLVAMLARLGKEALDAMQLGLWDRAGGAVAGCLTGLMLHAVLLSVMSILASEEWMDGTLEGSYSEPLLERFRHIAQRALEASDQAQGATVDQVLNLSIPAPSNSEDGG
jgi:uncharacterized membrane protein required for colicin V production